MSENRLIILSGPSCVGKSPLYAALRKFYPEISCQVRQLMTYHSRSPRPKEKEGVDYYFRSRDFVAGLEQDPRYIVKEVRNYLTALDIEELEEDLKITNILFEGSPVIGKLLLKHPQLESIPKVSIFLSPLSRDEIEYFQGLKERMALDQLIIEIMRRKLLKRTYKQKGVLGQKDLDDIEIRANSAWIDLQCAVDFDYVIVNHDGEDSDHWDAFYYPIGDARKALLALKSILLAEPLSCVEQWPKNLFT